MTSNNKILSVALAAAVLGGSAVGLINHSAKTTEPNPAAATTTTTTAATQPVDNSLPANNLASTQTQPVADAQLAANTSNVKDVQADYSKGYAEGFRDANGTRTVQPATRVVTERTSTVAPRTVTRTRYVNRAPRYSNTTAERRAYYDYSQPRQRSFWKKHQDKLTVAGGTVGGALIGGLIGGKKGAAIGALSGGGGSALYTYKIRNRNRRY
ncbi:MAG: hypothetical protein ABR577_09470 [Pyrinomonadaceae bacterium]